MRCPRCEGALATFTIEADDRTAVVCESCGFSGIPASHRPEGADAESWEQAITRFDEAALPPERTCKTDRTDGIAAPTADSETAIDPDRLEETVTVAASFRDEAENEVDDEDGDDDEDAPSDRNTA